MLRRVVGALRSHPGYQVVCATTHILDPVELGPPSERFFATRFLPAHAVSEMADVVVSHGGQGTVQTAVWAGKPVVGIGFLWEQQANLDGLARAGAGVRIPIHSVTPQRILEAVERVRAEPYGRNARALQALVRATDGAAEAVRLMNELARNRRRETP